MEWSNRGSRRLDPASGRRTPQTVRNGRKRRGRGGDKALEAVASRETARRRLIPEIEGLKRQQNAAADEGAKAKRLGQDTTALQEASRSRTAHIKQLGFQLDSV